jgi:hypothetical protein
MQLLLYALSRLQTINYPSTSIYCSYICCALPQRSRLSIDRLSRCHHRLPTCLLAMPNVTSLPRPCRPHRRLPRSSITSGASCRYRNAEGSRAHLPGMPVMNPRPHLALSFAHRRRLLLIFRPLYHAACRTAEPAQTCARVTYSTLPMPMPSRSNVRRGGSIVADLLSALASSRLVSCPYQSERTSPRTPGTGIAGRPRELPVDVPVRARK